MISVKPLILAILRAENAAAALTASSDSVKKCSTLFGTAPVNRVRRLHGSAEALGHCSSSRAVSWDLFKEGGVEAPLPETKMNLRFAGHS